MIGTTLVIVLVTVFVLGGLTIDTLKYLNLDVGVDFETHVEQVSLLNHIFLNFSFSVK